MADAVYPQVTDTPKKRKINGSKKENEKKMRLSNHKMGENCQCKRFQCFEVITLEQRQTLLDRFNAMRTKDEQDAFLCSCIALTPIQRRRPRKEEADASLHDTSYRYHLLVKQETVSDVQICFKAFLSIFGVTKSRLERLQKGLKTNGAAPVDQRGKHTNRPHAFSEAKRQQIMDHISSFRGRVSHYTLKKSRVLYLPEDLNLQRMHGMYMEAYPNDKCCIESYRSIFVEKFNIKFGYPRKDTCSTCDELKSNLNKDLSSDERAALMVQSELHLRKAQTFYDRKTAAGQEARANPDVVAACFDFWKNLPVPNVTTSDVYYKRQLSTYTFNIHQLASSHVQLYTYDETIGRKGANEVSSMLMAFFNTLPPNVTHLRLFCDSCPGQNKNWTVMRMLHYMVVHQRRFQEIRLHFPIRGHSYMECDQDMVTVNQKLAVETPEGWRQHFQEARKNPSKFEVINVTQQMLVTVEKSLRHLYYITCPFKVLGIREVLFSADHPRLIRYRENWNGPFLSSVVSKPVSKAKRVERPALEPTNTTLLPIPIKKFQDLQAIKRFCVLNGSEQFFASLPYQGQASTSAATQIPRTEDDDQSEISDEELSDTE